MTLDTSNPSTYKQLYRAAKAKLKLRLKITYPEDSEDEQLRKLKIEMSEPTPSIAIETFEPKPADGPKPLPEVLQLEPESKVLPIGNTKPRNEFADNIIGMSQARASGMRMKEAQPQPETNETKSLFWQVYCNSCDKSLSDAHFHCGICDKGDYDLCEACVNNGKLCPGEDHWLIKRFIKNGRVVNSTTEKVAPSARPMESEKEPEVPGAFKSEIDSDSVKPRLSPSVQSRTCNGCVRGKSLDPLPLILLLTRTTVLPESLLVECSDCDDFDLCMPCHVGDKHGHHPAHKFKPIGSNSTASTAVLAKCEPGRNVSHNASCDKCDKVCSHLHDLEVEAKADNLQKIVGVRHKCLNCPDWDYCNDCVKVAAKEHPGHRFVPIYDVLQASHYNPNDYTLHVGIYCDGPQCTGKANQAFIRGDRYKCAICHDTDFCANCEAHPNNKHNATHPLLKFKTPIKGVAVTTTGDDGQGQNLPVMGDRASVNPAPAAISNLRNLMEARPSTDTLPAYTPVAQPAAAASAIAAFKALSEENTIGLDAHFIKDVVRDGSAMSPGTIFAQTWTLRNPGPQAWPVGCSVRHVGGDDMLCINRSQPIETNELQNARRSNAVSVATNAGEEVNFTVRLCAPAREGKHISYWRLHDPEGVPFGHKLWCDIESKTAPVKSDKPSSCHSDYLNGFARLEAAQKARLAQAQQNLAKEKTAAAAAGTAWKSGLTVQPASSGVENTTADKTGMTSPVAPSTAPIMPAINNAARLAMPNQMRVRAMELQNRHRMLREQWKNLAPQNVQDRQKIGQEMQQLQQSMQQFASAYRSSPQAPAAENTEMRDLVKKQQNRRELYRQMPEGESKREMTRANMQLDNQEMMSLLSAQRQRYQQLGAQQAVGSIAPVASAAGAPAPRPVSETFEQQRQLQHQHQLLAQRRAQALEHQQRIRQLATQTQASSSGAMPQQSPPTMMQRPVSHSPYATVQSEYAKQHAANMANYAQTSAYGAQMQAQMRARAMPVPQPASVAQSAAAPKPSGPKTWADLTAGSNKAVPAVAQTSASSNVSNTSTQVKPKAPRVEDLPAVEHIEYSEYQSDDMVMPKLEKDGSPASSMELKSEKIVSEKAASEVEAATSDAAPSTAYSKANSTISETTAGAPDNLEDDFESVGAEETEVYDDAESGVYSDDDGFDTDEYDILDASDEEAMENARA